MADVLGNTQPVGTTAPDGTAALFVGGGGGNGGGVGISVHLPDS